ncbi:hypothetical protein CspHIS471_0205500 [Cutaneotrichosporon sp. HIS471]|nr:hypothetical protein CspHIS471_0205500 [Cutaneotrichosporon sp. HIS471]
MDEGTSDKRLESEPSEDKEVVVVGWDEDDLENPFNWSRRRKYINVLIPIYICLLTAANSTTLFLTTAFAAISAMYAGVYNYLADAYETYSASAQAAHGFSRSIFAACFPLLTHAMYFNLGFPIASTLVASIALVLGIAPVLIFVYGPRLRARSKVTSALTRGAF